MDPENSLGRLRWYNVGMGLLHAIQGIAVVALSNDFALPVTGTFMAGPPGTTGARAGLSAPRLIDHCSAGASRDRRAARLPGLRPTGRPA